MQTVLGPWAKLSRDPVTEQVTGSLGLVAHSADVAATSLALMAIPTILNRLETLAGRPLHGVDLARLGVLAFLHDIGKANAGFQSKSLQEEERKAFLRRRGIGDEQCGHTKVVAALLYNRAVRTRTENSWPLADIERWQGEDHSLFWASVSHHGTPLTKMSTALEATLKWRAIWDASDAYDPAGAVAELGRRTRDWFPEAFDDHSEPLPDAPAFAHAFAGLLSLADWIASNPHPDFFPFDGHGDGCRMAFARDRARTVVRRMRIDAEDARSDLAQRHPCFEDIFPFPRGPSPLQAACGDPNLGNLLIAEDETGAGKTEAALWRFKRLFEAAEVDSLAFVLPTRVAAVALEKRVRDFVVKLFPDTDLRPNVLLAVPGYLRVDGDEGKRDLLARFEFLWPDSDGESAAHRRWAAENSKRYLAASVAIGTVDQVLLSALTARHAHLRGFALLRSFLVVDEVHASDAYMSALLSIVLRRHVNAGGHAMLLSATLGSDARDRFFDRHLRKAHGFRIGDRRPDAPISGDPLAVPYPCITDKNGTRPAAPRGRNRDVEVTLVPEMRDPEAVAARAAHAVARGARVLVVRNTVGGAIDVQNALEALLGSEHPALFRADGIVCPHHGRFAAEDRRILDAAVEKAFGKASRQDRACVLVGTQTLEQSLDIDADLMITDIAPCDVLLQRIGRLHRHESRARPSGFEVPHTLILTPENRDLSPFLGQRRGVSRHGVGSVYRNMLSIEATWAELERRKLLHIPADNRALVEATTRSETLKAVGNSLGGNWTGHWIEFQGRISALRSAGQTHALDWDAPWDEQTWAEPGEQIRTRLGLDDRLAEFDRPVVSPFGQTLSRIKIPGWMARGVNVEADAQAEVVDEATHELTFAWGVQRFRYSRIGLEVVEDIRAGREIVLPHKIDS